MSKSLEAIQDEIGNIFDALREDSGMMQREGEKILHRLQDVMQDLEDSEAMEAERQTRIAESAGQ